MLKFTQMKKGYLKCRACLICFLFYFGGNTVQAQWTELGGKDALINQGVNGEIKTLALDKSGNVYAGGSLYSNNNRTNVVVFKNGVCSILGGQSGLPFLGQNIGGQYINSLVCDTNNNVFAGGVLPDNSGINAVGKFSGSSWNSFNINVNPGGTRWPIRKMVISPNNDLFILEDAIISAGGNYYNHGAFVKVNANLTPVQQSYFQNGSNYGYNKPIYDFAYSKKTNYISGNIPNGTCEVMNIVGDFTDGYSRFVGSWDECYYGTNPILVTNSNSGAFSYALPVGVSTSSGTYFDSTIWCIIKDNSDNYYVAGSFKNSNGNMAVYTTKGGNGWVELGGNNSLAANGSIFALAKDKSGNIYAAGDFKNAQGNRYVAKYDGTSWSELGGNNSLAANDAIQALAVDTINDIIYAGGRFENTTLIPPFYVRGYKYVAKYTKCVTTRSTTKITLCSVTKFPFSWNGQNFNDSGTYNVFLKNSVGCDSIATLVLELSTTTNPIPVTLRICNTDFPYLWKGKTFNGAGTYIDTIQNAQGCDEITTVNVISSTKNITNANYSTCDLYTKVGYNYGDFIAPGSYVQYSTNPNGCTDEINYTVQSTPAVWTGAVDNDFNNAANWSGATFPGGSFSIPAGTPWDPVINPFSPYTPGGMGGLGGGIFVMPTVNVRDVCIESGSLLRVYFGGELTITGDVSSNNNLDARACKVVLGFGNSNLLPSNAFLYNAVKDLTINPLNPNYDVYLQNTLNVTGVLKTKANLHTNDFLVLKSLSSQQAAVGIVEGSIVGKTLVERYIPKGYRTYRDLGAGVANAGSIFNNWQKGGAPSGFSMFGIFITGSSNGYLTNVPKIDLVTGFDVTLSGAPSMYQYNGSSWSSIANTKSTNLNPYQGYRTLIRGNRNFNLDNAPGVTIPLPPPNPQNLVIPLFMANDATITAKGNLLTGSVFFKSTINNPATINGVYSSSYGLTPASTDINGYSLIANPYWCPIDWTSIYGNGQMKNLLPSYSYLDPTISYTDPKTGTPYTAYVSYNPVTFTNSNPISNVNFIIFPGQGFFVQNDGSGIEPELTIEEYNKYEMSNQGGVFGATKKVNRLYATLWRDLPTQGLRNVDGTVAVFDNSFSKNIGKEDSKKSWNAGGNIYINQGNNPLSIEGLPLPSFSDSIHLGLSALTANQPFLLKFYAKELDIPGVDAYLVDKYLKTTTKLAADSTTITFTPTNSSATYNNRFVVTFKPSTTPLAVKFTAVKAQKADKAINVSWQTANEEGVATYTVERSADGKSFTAIGNQAAKNTASNSYTLVDSKPLAGNNYYRIKVTEANGTISYSNIVVVNMAGEKGAIKVYPNPVVGKTFTIQMSDLEKGNYSIRLVNAIGQVVLSQSLVHEGGSVSKSIALEKGIATGSYNLLVQTQEGVIVAETTLFLK